MKLIKETELYEVYLTEPKDWKKIKEHIMKIENSAFEEEVRQDEDDIESTFTDEKSICLIVKDKKSKKIVAYTMSSPLEDYEFLRFDPHYGKYDTLYIESTAVLPNYQGKGIGKLLKEVLIEEAKRRGYKRITTRATNEIIVHINEKYGFRKVKYFKEWVGNRDAWYMELKLDNAPGGI